MSVSTTEEKKCRVIQQNSIYIISLLRTFLTNHPDRSNYPKDPSYIYKLCLSIFNVNIYIKSKKFITQRVIFQFLPNLRRLNKITKSVKSTNLKTN